MAGGDLYALDFDGVLCDSCGESSLSALKAAKLRWSPLFDQVDAGMEAWIIEQMHILRPVVETGYENLLLVRLLVELQIPSARVSSVAEGLTVEAILESWSQIKPIIMEEWNEEKDPLVDLFGKVRDEWIEKDLSGWIGANRFYPGISDALRFASSRVYIVTTKQGRFADALLREIAGITIPSDRIFGLGSGPKVEVLKQLQSMPEHEGSAFHFVEDRLATLKNVIKEPALDGWNLYLGGWGYNTENERREAESIPRIRLLDLSDFSKKLKQTGKDCRTNFARCKQERPHSINCRWGKMIVLLFLPMTPLMKTLQTPKKQKCLTSIRMVPYTVSGGSNIPIFGGS